MTWWNAATDSCSSTACTTTSGSASPRPGASPPSYCEQGYAFDFVSDAQLTQLKVHDGAIIAPGGRYRVIVVPATRRMSVETLTRLSRPREAGHRVIFESLPQDVPGLRQLAERRARLRALHRLLRN